MVDRTKQFDEVPKFTSIEFNAKVFERLLCSSLLSLGLTACGPANEPDLAKQEVPIAVMPSASNPLFSNVANPISQSLPPAASLNYPVGSEGPFLMRSIRPVLPVALGLFTVTNRWTFPSVGTWDICCKTICGAIANLSRQI